MLPNVTLLLLEVGKCATDDPLALLKNNGGALGTGASSPASDEVNPYAPPTDS